VSPETKIIPVPKTGFFILRLLTGWLNNHSTNQSEFTILFPKSGGNPPGRGKRECAPSFAKVL
jgi:hypothetical protein